jgi:16S rRNA (guanine527-N7)-methyltransferase
VSDAGPRLQQLAARWQLEPTQTAALRQILDVLSRDELAPSAVPADRAVDVHIADSLSGLALECVRSAATIADLGAGAGFPGIILAIALPAATVELVESVARKCAFLERLCADAGVRNARVVRARAEELPAGAGRHDLVTARALAPLPVLCEYAAPLLQVGGSLVAWKGEVSAAEARAGERAAALLGLSPHGVVRSEPYAGSVAHHLHVYRKVAPTPPGYPRRPGMARKRPLGGPR